MEDALGALYKTLRATLTATTEVWGTRAYAKLAPAGAAFPYVVFDYAAGGELNQSVAPDAEFVIFVKGLAKEDAATAYAMAARFEALFNDKDGGALSAGTDWTIISITQEQRIDLLEQVDGAQIFHAGHRYRVRMESN